MANHKSRITWKRIKAPARHAFAPVGEPEPPDHKAYWRLEGGCPVMCCDRHQWFLVRQFPVDTRD